MPSTRALKTRIRSVKSTKQITKAMQMVAASKMRRAQDATKGSQPYARSANELLTHLAAQGATDEAYRVSDVSSFQSTRPHRARRPVLGQMTARMQFQSTRPHRARHIPV